jgi:hypothetical protein
MVLLLMMVAGTDAIDFETVQQDGGGFALPECSVTTEFDLAGGAGSGVSLATEND